jgi:TetR/AcrR family transcriptional repressor of nem operon
MSNTLHFDQEIALDQFLEIFWIKGYKATTTRELARGAGISESSLFNCFHSKRDIYITSLNRYHEMSKSRRSLMEDEKSALSGIRKYWESIAKLAANPSRTRGCMITNATVELIDDPEIAKYLKSVHNDYTRTFKKTLDRAVRQGELKKGTDTLALAQYLSHSAQGLRLLSRTNPGKAKVKNIVDLTMSTLKQFST